MTPRPRTYDTEEERLEAHRARQQKYLEKKRGLRQKLSELINGNKETEDTTSIPETIPEPKVVRVIMDTNSNEGSTSPNKLGSEPKKLFGKCVWCGISDSSKAMKDGKCSYCQRFKSAEEMEYMTNLQRNLSILPSDINKKRIYDEELEKFRKGQVTKIVRHKLE